MSPKQLAKFKALLIEQRAEVSTEIEEHSDRVTLPESEVESAIVNSNDNLLEKIELALRQIEDGSYGKCESCGKEIAEARLLAKPAVSLCTSCQEIKENEQGHR
ncbi:MAG: TraR/DksA family transcriptional regulator [Verrucomicrobiales bacterium]